MPSSLKDREAAFAKDALTMKDSERDSKEKSLSQLRVEVQRKERELREDINIRRNEELGGLQEQINKAVTSVAKADRDSQAGHFWYRGSYGRNVHTGFVNYLFCSN